MQLMRMPRIRFTTNNNFYLQNRNFTGNNDESFDFDIVKTFRFTNE
jgi:hypothetical protein